MRRIIQHQLSFVEPAVLDHPHARELQQISELLDLLDADSGIFALVYENLVQGLRNPATGREGSLTAEQLVRALLIKQMHEYSYEDLAFHLADSRTFRSFCRIGIEQESPSSSTLQRDIKQISPETLKAINRAVLRTAEAQGIEKGRTVRVDCTVVESNIHHPTDSSLLYDGIRTLARLLGQAVTDFDPEIKFVNHRRRAKRRALEILNARNQKTRKKSYRDLLLIAERSVAYAQSAADTLDRLCCDPAARQLAKELRAFSDLTLQVMDQTQRRVFGGETVPAKDKVFSLFEPHTDIIKKDRRETYYGHKIALTGGASGLFTDLVILEGNPADSTLATDMIARQKEIYGRVPLKVAFDGGFSSRKNLQEIKDLGVRDVCFHKKRGLEIKDMAKSTWVYKQLRSFRAGIEGMISFLKRCFGLRRCTWRSLESFKAYAWTSVVTANLMLMARHMLK